MKKLLPVLVALMFFIACGTGFFVYGAYQDYKGDKSSIISNTSIINDVDLSDYPTGVINGYVSVEYFDAVYDFYNSVIEFSKKSKEMIESNKYDLHNPELISLRTEHLKSLNGIKYNITTSQEQEIDEYVSSAIYHQKSSMEYFLQYHQTKKYVHYELALDEDERFKSDWKIAYSIMSDYQITK